ncbi:hypothetical protein TTHERM_00192060 (macronuclear) [Tetrahymena thermophila SB210]|uniref:Uncharacterized protein n=1 Tax=Tetrahymena thermophila (strain SB210) TaxID=312017 RepID=I7M836_TETTS|nr:hypothetical protein TTHERM_00192060 [Tetrahymena thermophila SB210]EAR96537.1 hypothetical protein TTHERM_00192060 [Tetrahymena thermophila SB210]|eukprot:XP_001016782.1 hypothetical protein TTHERM_00192060 [Tetrahymena thermophila SB210]
MEVLSAQDQLVGMNFNRPMTAASTKNKKTLGSTCPIIIKHEFPNEQKHYIDNVGQEMSSTKKRFIYDRPNTAKIQQNSIAQQSGFQGMKRSQSGQGLSFNQNAIKRSSLSAISQSSYQINSADLYNKLLEGQKIKKEDRFVIKPARKLNTFQIHSALFKIKKQKEELDFKIRELEDIKSNFNEMDFYLIANAGAVDYMFNAGALSQTNIQMNKMNSQETRIIEQNSENQIPSLANINTQSESSIKKASQIINKISQPKKQSPAQFFQKQVRPQTSVPKAKLSTNQSNNNNILRAATAKANSRDQIEMLRGESRDESHDKGIDLEILGNCMKIFQEEERVQVEEWGKDLDNSDQVKQTIDKMGQTLPTINRLLSPKSATVPLNPGYGEIKEEEEQEDLQIQPFESLQKQFQEQNYQQFIFPDNHQTNNLSSNSPYSNLENQNQYKIGDQQYLQQDGNHQAFNQNGNYSDMNSSQKVAERTQQNEFNATNYSKNGKMKQSKRIHSATSQHGLFRPQSSSVNSNWFSQQFNIQNRPYTAMSSNKNKASHHAMMSYGPVQVIKEQITRNYDHLEVLAESKSQEIIKKQKEIEKIGQQKDWQNLQVQGTRLPINIDTYIDLQFKTKQALANMNYVQQVDLNGNANQQYFQNTLPFTESHFFSAPKQIQGKNSQQNRPETPQGQFIQPQQNVQMQPQQLQQVINYQNFQQLHSVSSHQTSRAAIDLNEMQKDQSIKFLRPGTAKPSSSQSSRLSQQNKISNNVQNINVPFAESVAVKLNHSSNNQPSNDNLQGVQFANADINFNIQNSSQFQYQQNQQFIPENINNLQMAQSNVYEMPVIVSDSSGKQSQNTVQSLQQPPNLQQYQVLGQQEFQFQQIENQNQEAQNPDDLTVQKRNRPQTAMKK